MTDASIPLSDTSKLTREPFLSLNDQISMTPVRRFLPTQPEKDYESMMYRSFSTNYVNPLPHSMSDPFFLPSLDPDTIDPFYWPGRDWMSAAVLAQTRKQELVEKRKVVEMKQLMSSITIKPIDTRKSKVLQRLEEKATASARKKAGIVSKHK
jgi:hypothetical protein